MVSWHEIKQITESKDKSAVDIRRECLWLNQFIKIKKQVVNWEEWHRKGINQINNVTDGDGTFLTEDILELRHGKQTGR